MREVLIVTVIVVAVSAMKREHAGRHSECGPDPKRVRFTLNGFIKDCSPNEILEAVVRHARPDPVLGAKMALVDKTHFGLVRDTLRNQRLSRIVIQLPTSRDNFIRDIKWLINICRDQCNVAVLRDLLTEETAPLFMYRLLSLVMNNPDVIKNLFDVIGHLESVAELTPGWVLIIHRHIWLDDLKSDDPLRLMCLHLLNKIPSKCVYRSISDIPVDLLKTIRQYEDLTPANLQIRGRLPDPFAGINPMSILDVARLISEEYGHHIRSRPILARKLFFLGTPIFLDLIEVVQLTVSELRDLLPFTLYVLEAVAILIGDLIASSRSDLISVIFKSEAFLSPPLYSFVQQCFWLSQIVRSLIEAEGQHDLLRMLLEAPLPDGWIAKIVSWRPILHLAVQTGNVGAVRVLLKFPDLIQTDIVDYVGLTARSYTEPGSEIDTLFKDLTVFHD